jgi:hypothetical protein
LFNKFGNLVVAALVALSVAEQSFQRLAMAGPPSPTTARGVQLFDNHATQSAAQSSTKIHTSN